MNLQEHLTTITKDKSRQVGENLRNVCTYFKACNTCCGTREFTNLSFFAKQCSAFKYNLEIELAFLLQHHYKATWHLLYYTTTKMDTDGNGDDSQAVVKLLKEWGFTEFVRFINPNYPYRANEDEPTYTIGLQYVPEGV